LLPASGVSVYQQLRKIKRKIFHQKHIKSTINKSANGFQKTHFYLFSSCTETPTNTEILITKK